MRQVHGARVRNRIAFWALAASMLVAGTAIDATPAVADEGGASFWVPGYYGSLAATPVQPGWSFATIYYHTSVSAGANVAFARQVSGGNLTANLTGNLNAHLNADADLVQFAPTYTFAQEFLGAQAAVLLLVSYGRSPATVDATLTGNLGLGGPGFTIGGNRTDEVTGFSDPSPQFTLKWNKGVHNFMTYVTGNIAVGDYDPKRLANLGLGHEAVDAGGGYTYFNPQTGNEFSAVLGFTYNFMNNHTQYQSGVDAHLDWGTSKFLTKQWQIGVVGYAYQQLSCDSGSGDRVGCFESRVFGIGPQVGYVFPVGDMMGYLNLKAYGEFNPDNRADGYNVWLTFALSPSPSSPASPRRLITK